MVASFFQKVGFLFILLAKQAKLTPLLGRLSKKLAAHSTFDPLPFINTVLHT